MLECISSQNDYLDYGDNMDNFLVFNSVNFFSLIMLIVLIVDISLYLKHNQDFHREIWCAALVSATIAQIFEIACWYVNGRTGVFYTIMGYGFNIILFTFSAIMTGKMALYIEYSAEFKMENYIKLKKVCYGSAAFVTIICVLNLWGHFIYSIGANNIYQRESWYYLMIIGIFFPLIYVLAKLIIKYASEFNKIVKDNQLITLLIAINIIVPIGLIVLQGANIINVAVIFPFISLSILIIHMMTMANTAGIDFLTKLKNNFGVSKHISYFPKYLNYYYAIVFFDLNDFKSINDKFGHKEGDEVLKTFAKILAREIKSSDFAARHGGDEFIIGVNLKAPEEIEGILKNIQADLDKHNQGLKDYKMSYSYGISITEPKKTIDYEQMINEADKNMYKNKPKSKQVQLDL